MNYGVDTLRGKLYVEMFEYQVEKTPNKIAVNCEDKNITYRELNQKANQLARRLRNEGIKPDSLIGIMADRSIEMVVAILAIFKAGGAYLPIDPKYPEERKTYLVNDSNIGMILVNGADSHNIDYKAKILDLDSSASYNTDSSNLRNINSLNDLAYVIYTSGSTGRPKGAMIEHAGMINHIQAKINDLGINDNSIIAQNASQCFDISVWQFLTSLLVGAKTVILTDKMVLNPTAFINKLIEQQVTILEVVPSYLSALINHIEIKKLNLKDLRYLISTGETLTQYQLNMWYKLFPNTTVVNAYGPTEASDDITHYFINKEIYMERIPIGKPIQNLNIYIINENMKPCEVGERGEIWVSGICVGRGYINHPDLTREVFVNDPFKQDKNIRLYKTGDIGAWLPDGNIDFYGRKDYQVKINGFRIELGEIDIELLKFSYIEEAVTVAYERSQGGDCLCSYIVLKKEVPILDIKEHVSKKLPEYMVPSLLVRLDKLPLTENGKVDRNALPDPLHTLSEVDSANEEKKYVIGDFIELKIREILLDVLDIGAQELNISRDEQLSNYGMDSLGYIKLIVKIEKEFDFEFLDEDLDFNKYPDLISIIEFVKSKMNT